jgi:SET domain-containing protein
VSSPKIVVPEPGLFELVDIKGKGRGVIARKPIAADQVIEAAPVIKMKKKDRLTRETVLSHYPFTWEEPPYVQAFGLGYVGLINHSDDPNCRVEMDIEDQVLRVIAIKDIEPGTELVHNYGIEPWFKVK